MPQLTGGLVPLQGSLDELPPVPTLKTLPLPALELLPPLPLAPPFELALPTPGPGPELPAFGLPQPIRLLANNAKPKITENDSIRRIANYPSGTSRHI